MMLDCQPRIRMFAGPNGSGKSMLKSILRPELLGVYVNPDEIEKNLKKFGFVDFREFDIVTSQNEVVSYFLASSLLQKANLSDSITTLTLAEQKLSFANTQINSYFSSILAEFIRRKLMKNLQSFSFETVMSSPDKIELLKTANQLGYKTYLYFIATECPEINISRIKYRVSCGGHDVPKDKVISRYYRSLELLIEAVKNSYRAYIFDNSGSEEFLLAEVQNGKIVDIKSKTIPAWFKSSLIDKIQN